MRPRTLTVALALALTGVLAGCSGSDDNEPKVEQPPPRVRTAAQWGKRLEPFITDMDDHLRVLNTLRHPQVKLYLYTGNTETLEVVNSALDGLSACSRRVERAGRPPAGNLALARAHRDLRRACGEYERLAELLREGIPLLSSDNPDAIENRRKLFNEVAGPSRRAAIVYGRALETLGSLGLLPAPAA